jgi:hypothetical protein
MADLYSSLGSNARRIVPSSTFGTPQLTSIVLNTDGETLPNGSSAWCPNDDDLANYNPDSDFASPGSDAYLAVRAIQQYCEVFQVGGSSDSSFLTVIVRDSSIPYGEGQTFQSEGQTVTALQTAVREALGGTAVLVYIGRITDDDTDG